MQRILIAGATSAIAEAVARRYAMRGCALFLTGRRAERVEAIAQDLRLRGAAAVDFATLDACDVSSYSAVLDSAWRVLGAVDVVLIAHGTLPDQARCVRDVEYAVREFTVNGTAAIALATAIAERLEAQGSGTLAVISSVAGDRGRASNYVYGAAKAAVSAFLSGLRQRLHARGVNVLTIKPGFVDTPMTAAFKKGVLWARPDRIADGIVRAVERGVGVAYVPAFWRGIMAVIRAIPEPVFRRIRL